jgi:deoxyribodipyrimidine photo-lyase
MAAIFWFRRDLRLEDNAGLYHALKQTNEVVPVFIFDKNILNKLEDKTDARVTFIHREITRIQNELRGLGSDLKIYYGHPETIWDELLTEHSVSAVYTNNDYEPYAQERDNTVRKILNDKNIPFYTYKDQCIFEKDEVLKDDGKPYTVFTPYSRKWKAKLTKFHLKPYPTEKYFSSFSKNINSEMPTLESMGFEKSDIEIPDREFSAKIINSYHLQRNFPAIKGTSRLSVHLRFGTISVRALAKFAQNKNETFLNELIWRDFYMMILWHFPHVANGAFKPQYDQIEWRNNEKEYELWCEGKTGYPLVDAGMRELNATGIMHNRVRMVVASFLCKHLLIDWRWGEAYFAKKLLDFDLSANNGGWQWAAGSGCDAAPYFRIFNPQSQLEKFDKELVYTKKWVPEFDDPFQYSKPIVDHKMARERCLATYKAAVNL